MIIETERLILREMNQEDFSSLSRIMQDSDTMYAYEWPFTDEEVESWLNKQMKNYEIYGYGLWAVILKETSEMIGQCGLTRQKINDRVVLEIGYLFQKEFWHKGYATEAAIACKDYAFNKLNAKEVYSIIRETNTASINVAKRNGMILKERFIKHYRGVDMPHVVFCVEK
ncbi:MAG: GNAT family N-acetyltransferase [Bacillales bacterium]|nr:GNAT family N-acetyltransferase [Bacillales bacterium]